MNLIFVLLILIKLVTAKINIEVDVTNEKNVTVKYSGKEINLISNEDIKQFKLHSRKFSEALKTYLGGRPNNVYFKSPTPWGDLYKSYKWEQVRRVLLIKSARIKEISKRQVVVMSQDFQNLSNQTVKVNTGITHSVENTLTTSWSKNKEFSVSQEIAYNINVIFAKLEGATTFSYTINWGFSEEKSETVNIGTNSGMETELKPGQAVTAVLSANAGYLEIEVNYNANLQGNVAVNYKKSHNGHHFWGPRIENVMKEGGINNDVNFVETIKCGFYVDASLKVYDKGTGETL